MNFPRPAIGSAVRIDCQALESLITAMHHRGYQVIGPSHKDSAITYNTVRGINDLPIGWTARQDPASYRLERRQDSAMFGYATPANSLKSFLHPPEIRLFSAERSNGAFRILPNQEPAARYAFLGVRACELSAARLQDRVLMEDRFADAGYRDRRRNAIVIAVQCTEAAGTCFCSSMGTGPRATEGFDLALTELIADGSHEFLVEVGTDLGAELLAEVEHSSAAVDLQEKSEALTRNAEGAMQQKVDIGGLAAALRQNFDHPHWDDVAARCLACGNCTQVCPTCFCVNVEDSSDVTGNHAERWRKWDSCFTLGFSYIHGGSVRVSTKSRYRQWLTHKFSYWHDQFGSAGCVGCGRCIAWCPAGIDVTKEIAALREPVVAEGQERGAQ